MRAHVDVRLMIQIHDHRAAFVAQRDVVKDLFTDTFLNVAFGWPISIG